MKRPQQKRALETRDKILTALETLLETAEFEAISIADIAREGQVAVGSVYSHFKDKTALLPAIVERRSQRVEDRMASAQETNSIEGVSFGADAAPDLKSLVRQMLLSAHAQVMKERGVMRALLTYRRTNPGLRSERAEDQVCRAYGVMRHVLEPYSDQITSCDLDQAARITHHTINILFLDKIVLLEDPLPEALRATDNERIDAYTEMIFGYLTGSSGGR